MNSVIHYSKRTWHILNSGGELIGFINRDRHCEKTLVRINDIFFTFNSVGSAKNFAIKAMPSISQGLNREGK